LLALDGGLSHKLYLTENTVHTRIKKIMDITRKGPKTRWFSITDCCYTNIRVYYKTLFSLIILQSIQVNPRLLVPKGPVYSISPFRVQVCSIMVCSDCTLIEISSHRLWQSGPPKCSCWLRVGMWKWLSEFFASVSVFAPNMDIRIRIRL